MWILNNSYSFLNISDIVSSFFIKSKPLYKHMQKINLPMYQSMHLGNIIIVHNQYAHGGRHIFVTPFCLQTLLRKWKRYTTGACLPADFAKRAPQNVLITVCFLYKVDVTLWMQVLITGRKTFNSWHLTAHVSEKIRPAVHSYSLRTNQ